MTAGPVGKGADKSKDQILAKGDKGGDKSKDQILGKRSEEGKDQDATEEPKKVDLKQKGEQERDKLRKRERKSLMKSLTLAQKSTASMGKFDKKAGKNEPAAPATLVKNKKKGSSSLNAMEHKHGKGGAEKERNLKILQAMTKEKDYHAGNLGAKGAQNTDKMVKVFKKKEQKYNKD